MNRLTLLLLLCVGPVLAAEPDYEQRLQAAEQRLQEAAEELAQLTMQLHGDEINPVIKMMTRGRPSRAILGINVGRVERIDDQGNRERRGDRDDGVEVFGVSPGGPAASAGLEAGDIITALDGQPLAGAGARPDRRLMQLMDEVEPGSTVTLTYLRDGVERTAQVVTGSFAEHAFAFPDRPTRPLLAPGELDTEVFAFPPRMADLLHHRGWRGLELVAVEPRLGRYFGTDKGLLVVRAPDSDLPLEPGDVIMTIGGATPDNVPDAMRLLRFYKPGDKLVLEIMRERRGKTLEVLVPERSG